MGLPRRVSAGAPLLLLSIVLTLAAVGACGGNVVFVEDGGEGGSGGFGTTKVGPQTTTTFVVSSNTTSGSTTNVTTIATTVGTTNVSSSTGGDCVTCGQFLNGEGQDLPFCPGSGELYDALIDCVCFAQCARECVSTCQGMGQPNPDCEDCIFGPCGGTLDACFNDF